MWDDEEEEEEEEEVVVVAGGGDEEDFDGADDEEEAVDVDDEVSFSCSYEDRSPPDHRHCPVSAMPN